MIYLVEEQGTGFVKIGFTDTSPQRRLADLQTGNPRPLRLVWAYPGGQHLERAFHRHFAHLRAEGEWFQHDPIMDSPDALVAQWRAGVVTAKSEGPKPAVQSPKRGPETPNPSPRTDSPNPAVSERQIALERDWPPSRVLMTDPVRTPQGWHADGGREPPAGSAH